MNDFIEVDGQQYVSMERYRELSEWAQQIRKRLDYLEEKDAQLTEIALQARADMEKIKQAEHDRYIAPLAQREIAHNFDCGFVYVIRDVEVTGYYKIGRTFKMQHRFRQFACALPFKCEFIFHIPTVEMSTLELRLHKKFADKRKKGEWFDLNDADLKYIRSLRAY